MEHELAETAVARQSALIYTPLAVGAAMLFLLLASLGDYPTTARVGGAVWVGLLSLIVAMPLVTARVKERLRGTQPSAREESAG